MRAELLQSAIADFRAATVPVPQSPGNNAEITRRLARLLASLDGLATVYHATEATPGDPQLPDPPRADAAQIRGDLVAAFPSLGHYAVVTPVLDPEAEVLMGDAIDDLADITSELRDVEWRLANTTAADATWAFRFGFEHHWGRHLADVRSYLHYELFGR